MADMRLETVIYTLTCRSCAHEIDSHGERDVLCPFCLRRMEVRGITEQAS